MSAGEELLGFVIAEYWLAGVFGRVWLRLRPGLRSAFGEMPARAVAVARGTSFPAAAQLMLVQDFAARVWWRFAMVSVLLFGPVIAVAAAVRPGPVGTGVTVDLMLVLGCLAAVGSAQVIMLRLRAGRTAAFVRRQRRLEAGFGGPLPAGSGGLPRRSADDHEIRLWSTLLRTIS